MTKSTPTPGKLLLLSSLLVLFVCGTLASAVFAQSSSQGQAQAGSRYLPEYTTSGDLVLPKNFHEWSYVGSPLTPNALNGGMANFPEFHNVYIEPGSYAIYQKTNVFPLGTIFFKELQLTKPAEEADGSRTEPSGRGYFPGEFNGAVVTVKDSKRYADTAGWGYKISTIMNRRPPRPSSRRRKNAASVIWRAQRRTRSGHSFTGCWTSSSRERFVVISGENVER